MLKRKQTKTGIEELHEVRNAGYTATKKVKRDKSVNRRAGLHDKLNTTEGEVRVKRRKPLALKHVRRMRKVAAVAAVGVVGAVAVVGVGFFAPKKTTELNKDFETVCYEVPADGTKPTDHTLVENVGYMNYVLQNQEYWSSEMFSTVVSMGFSQTVETYKQYYNEVLISADIAKGFSSKATQFCVANGIVMWRPSANKNFDKMNTPWSTGEAQAMTVNTFKKNRGFPPSEFSVYVLNELTIANAYDYSVVDNGNGTYSMTLNLNVNTGEDETSADYYYKLQMKVTGDLYDCPDIHTTSVTYTFDESWRVLEFEISDSYNAPIAANFAPSCTSSTKVVFDYSEENAKNTFWEDYFESEYDKVKDTLVDDDKVEDNTDNAMGFLSGAFASVLTEGAVFKVDLSIDNLDLNGVVSVEMENSNFSGLSAKLGDLLVWLDGNTLYINDGSSKYKLNTDGLLSSGEEEGGDILGGFDIAALMDQMTEGEFVFNEATGIATLSSEVELFGLKVKIEFEFEMGENGVELNFLNAQIPLGEKVVNANLCFGNESDKPAIPADVAGYQDLLNDGITFDISLNANGLALDGVAKILTANGGFAGVYATLGETEVYYDCPHNMLYLSVGSAKYKLDFSKLDAGDINLGALDINSLLKTVLSNLYADENSFGSSLDINIDAIESVLKAAFDIQLFGGLKVDAGLTLDQLNVSLSAALTNEDVVLPDLAGYTDILNSEITFDVSLTLVTGLADEAGNRNKVSIDGKVALALKDGELSEIRADFGGVAVYYEFSAKSLYIKVGTTKVMLDLAEANGGSIFTAFNSASVLSDGLPTVIKELLTNLVAESEIISSNAHLTIMDAIVPVWAELDLSEDLRVSAGLTVFGVDATAKVGLSQTALDGLSDEEKEEYINLLEESKKVVESLLGNNISATVTGTLYSYEEAYADYGYEKYNFNASLEYGRGAANEEEVKLEDIYIHLNLRLTAKNPADDSLYLDLVIMDANPVTGADGRTTGGYITDGALDIYLSVSKYAENAVPLNIYAPVDEILTLVSMVGAMANLKDVSFANDNYLTAAVGQIADLLDGMLISKYLPDSVQDKFASLGESLIPQILGVSLEQLLNDLFGNIDTAEKEASSSFSLAKEYVSSITTTQDALTVVLNSSAIYDKEIDAADNIFINFTRVLKDGVYFVDRIGVENIFFGENEVNKLNLGLKLGYDEIARPDSGTAFVGYLNADGLDTLVNGLINSVTHKVDETEDEYDLNHYYLLNGKVTATINVIGIKINANIYIKSLAVYIDENNEVAINAHIYYDGVQEFNQIAIAGDSDVYLSIKGGNVCIKRIQYTHYETSGLITKEVTDNPAKEEVRSMTLKEFSDDLMDNLTFIFNFGPVILNNIPDSGSSDNPGVSFDGLDFGACLNTVIAAYVTEENSTGASWTVSFNGDLIKAYTGMNTSDIPVKFNADLNADGTYTVKSLEILKTSMELFGSTVKLELTGGLTYCNPNEQMGEGYTDTSKDLFNMNVTVNSDYDLPYIVSSFTWACGSYIKLPVGVAGTFGGDSYILDGYTATTQILGTQDVQFVDFVEENGIRYGLIRLISDTEYTAIWNKAYTVSFVDENGVELYKAYYHENEVLNFGNMPACPERDGYTAQWVGENGVVANGCAVTENMTFKVDYTKAPLKVTFNSSVEFNYTGYDGNYKLLNVGFEEGASYAIADATAEGYAFLGWWYNDNGEWRKITSVEEFIDAGAVNLEALWVKVTVNGSGTYYDKNWKYNYTIAAETSYEFAGNADLVNKINCSYTSYRYYINDNENLTNDSGAFYEENSFVSSHRTEGQITTNLLSAKKKWHAVVVLKFNVAGEELSVQTHACGDTVKIKV
ncbi:MAG: hypothetical protein K2O89_07170 [Clostridia bacterium]|nr:hypothetical protein [Clostridia bacterium]